MKYLFCNDIKNLFKDKSLILIMIVLGLEFVFQFIIIDREIVNLLLGRNLESLKHYVAMLFFLLHALLFIFVALNIYLNDMIYNIDNIFFRITPIKFICEKVIFLIISTVILRGLEYILILPTIISNAYMVGTIVRYFIKDILFYLLLSLMIILLREYKWLLGEKSLWLMVIFLILVPKNIDVFYICYLIGIIIFMAIILFSIKVFVKRIIESEGVRK